MAIRNRLQSFGYTVQVVIDESVNATNATGKGLVLISSTVGSGNVTNKFRDVAVPVINWETALQDDFGFATSSAMPARRRTSTSPIRVIRWRRIARRGSHGGHGRRGFLLGRTGRQSRSSSPA